MAIPKLIHQTVKDKSSLPDIFKQNIDKLRQTNPGWKYRLYDDNDIITFVSDHYDSDMLKLYLTINASYGAAKADFFRYLLMLKFGGVYLDIKSTAVKRLDDVLLQTDTYVLSHWNNKKGELFEGYGMLPGLPSAGEYQQWHIIAEPDHPFLREVVSVVSSNIENYSPSRHGTGLMGVMRTTGPLAYTLAIQRVQNDCPFRLVNIEDLGFVYSIVASASDITAHETFLSTVHYRRLRAPIVFREFFDPSGNVLDLSSMRRNNPCPCGSGRRVKHCHGLLY